MDYEYGDEIDGDSLVIKKGNSTSGLEASESSPEALRKSQQAEQLARQQYIQA
jgi:hypothetical protein